MLSFTFLFVLAQDGITITQDDLSLDGLVPIFEDCGNMVYDDGLMEIFTGLGSSDPAIPLLHGVRYDPADFNIQPPFYVSEICFADFDVSDALTFPVKIILDREGLPDLSQILYEHEPVTLGLEYRVLKIVLPNPVRITRPFWVVGESLASAGHLAAFPASRVPWGESHSYGIDYTGPIRLIPRNTLELIIRPTVVNFVPTFNWPIRLVFLCALAGVAMAFMRWGRS